MFVTLFTAAAATPPFPTLMCIFSFTVVGGYVWMQTMVCEKDLFTVVFFLCCCFTLNGWQLFISSPPKLFFIQPPLGYTSGCIQGRRRYPWHKLHFSRSKVIHRDTLVSLSLSLLYSKRRYCFCCSRSRVQVSVIFLIHHSFTRWSPNNLHKTIMITFF